MTEKINFRPGVYRYKHKCSPDKKLATAELSKEQGYIRFDWPDGTWDQWPVDGWKKDWVWHST